MMKPELRGASSSRTGGGKVQKGHKRPIRGLVWVVYHV